MSTAMRPTTPRAEVTAQTLPPRRQPSPSERLFYLLFTAAGSMLVYQSFPKSLRGIATLGVASFGVYHSFGMTNSCVKRVASGFFRKFGGNGGDFGGRFPEFPSYPHPSSTPPSRGEWGAWGAGSGDRPHSYYGAGGVDRSERQEKRKGNSGRSWGDNEAHSPTSSPFLSPGTRSLDAMRDVNSGSHISHEEQPRGWEAAPSAPPPPESTERQEKRRDSD